MTVQITSLTNTSLTLTSVPGAPYVLQPFKTARFDISALTGELISLDTLRKIQAEVIQDVEGEGDEGGGTTLSPAERTAFELMDAAGLDLLTAADRVRVQNIPSAVQRLVPEAATVLPYRYTGSFFDLALTTDGAPTVPAFPTPPADAVAVELWASSSAASDGIAWACRSGILSSTGVLATNTSNNIGTTGSVPSRHVLAGARMTLPLPSMGAAIPAGWRFALLNTNGIKLRGQYISLASGFRYAMTSTQEILSVGAGATVLLPSATAAIFPTGYRAALFQVIGPGVLFTWDGVGGLPSSTVGIPLPAGTYAIDQTLHGLSLAALKFYIPTSSFIVGHVWQPAA